MNWRITSSLMWGFSCLSAITLAFDMEPEADSTLMFFIASRNLIDEFFLSLLK